MNLNNKKSGARNNGETAVLHGVLYKHECFHGDSGRKYLLDGEGISIVNACLKKLVMSTYF